MLFRICVHDNVGTFYLLSIYLQIMEKLIVMNYNSSCGFLLTTSVISGCQYTLKEQNRF